MVSVAGRAKLLEWMRECPRRTAAALARACGVSQPAVSAWCRGAARPEPVYRDALQILTGIPAEDWCTRAELQHAARVARRAEEHRARFARAA